MPGAETMLKWITPALLAVSVAGTTAVAQYRLSQVEAELRDQSDSIDENEDAIDDMTLQQLREIGELQGDVKLILRLVQDLKLD